MVPARCATTWFEANIQFRLPSGIGRSARSRTYRWPPPGRRGIPPVRCGATARSSTERQSRPCLRAVEGRACPGFDCSYRMLLDSPRRRVSRLPIRFRVAPGRPSRARERTRARPRGARDQDRTDESAFRGASRQLFPCLRQTRDDRAAAPTEDKSCDGPRPSRVGCGVLQLLNPNTFSLGGVPSAETLRAIHSVPRISGWARLTTQHQAFDGDGFQAVLVRQEADCLSNRPQLVEDISRVRAPRSREVNQRVLPSVEKDDSPEPRMPLASEPPQHFRQIPCTVKHTHDQRRAAIRCVHNDVGIASNRKKADRWRRQMRPRGADQGMFADGGRQPVQGHAKVLGRNRVLGGYPLDDCTLPQRGLEESGIPFWRDGLIECPVIRSPRPITVAATCRRREGYRSALARADST